jgi:hypothetical protein
LESNLPSKNDNKELSLIKNWLTLQIQNALTWINSEDGLMLSNAIKSLGSYLMVGPTEIILPYIFDLSNSTLRRRFLPDFSDLMNRLDEESGGMNESFLKSELGQELLKETIRELINQTDEEKREYHKRFLINAYTMPDISLEKKRTFMNILTSLDRIDLEILKALWHPEDIVNEIIGKNKINSHIENNTTIALKSDLMKFLGIEFDLSERSVFKLEFENLISTKQFSAEWSDGTYKNDNLQYAIERTVSDAKRILTGFGLNFLASVTKENKSVI